MQAQRTHRLAIFSCDHCGADFESRVRNDRPTRYCSRRCAGIASREGKALPWQERFWRFLPDPRPAGCWEWQGYHRPPNGYGILPLGAGRSMLAHRASYFIHFRELPPEIAVCHSCDNPPCVNPAHLFEGTRTVNNADRDAKGRHVALSGEHNGRATIADSTVAQIREWAAGDMPTTEIAYRSGVSPSYVRRIVNGTARPLRGMGADEGLDLIAGRAWGGAS
jgi:hypothetical protein